MPEGSGLALDVTLTSVDDGVLAHADADLHVHGECVRCLRDLDEDRSVRIDELYLFPEVIEAQRAEGDEEVEDLLAVGETTLDLEPALRDALVPTLPFQPLCRPDCPGCAPTAGSGSRICPPATTTRSSIRAGRPWPDCWGPRPVRRARTPRRTGPDGQAPQCPPARTDTSPRLPLGPSIDTQLLDLA